ncbi:MAG: NAD(+)/NADH kinase [Phycisphaerales bacterium]|nr:NAD(+)/NADH kinase [Phycisphaerales bacterium]
MTGFAPTSGRIAIVASPGKPSAQHGLSRVQEWIRTRGEVVFAEVTHDVEAVSSANPDLLVVLGGDGTLIAAVRALGERQVPIVGVNLGKLGYLAEFTLAQLEASSDFLFDGSIPITRRIMLCVEHFSADGSVFRTLAVNDCVALAGVPFRVIELSVEADGDRVAVVRGDGLIIATPSGSTAHNLSAGGPILEPTAHSFILTPICPHALTYRPLLLGSERRITLTATRANPGTTIVIDGQIARPFALGDRVVLTRHVADFLLVRNPRHSIWHTLRTKLKWGEGPAA